MQYVLKFLKNIGLFSLSFILGIFILSSNILRSMPEQIKEQTRIHATIYTHISDDERVTMQREIENLNKVKNVTFSTKEEELKYLLEYYKDDGTLEILYSENNPLQDTFIIEVNNLDYVEDVINSIDQFDGIDQINSNHYEINEIVGRSNIVLTILNVITILLIILTGIKLRHCKVLLNNENNDWKSILINIGLGLLATLVAVLMLFISYDSMFAGVKQMLEDTGLKLLSINEQIIPLTLILLLFSMVWSITSKCKEIKEEDLI